MPKALIVEVFANAKQFTAELDRAAGKTRAFGKAAGVAGLAVAGGLAYGLEKSVQAASKMQTTTATMDTAFHAAGVNVEKWSGKIDQAEAKGRNLGFTNIDVRESLAQLVTATQDGGKALTDMSIGEDLARKKHISLTDSTKILSSAMAGSTRAARQLGISVAAVHDSTAQAAAAYTKAKKAIDDQFPSVSKMTAAQKAQKAALLANLQAKYTHIKADAQLKDKQATAAQVINTVSQRVKGQAKAFSDTAAGGAARFKAQMEALQENLGTALLPALNKIVSALAVAAGWLAKHTTIAKILVTGLGLLAAALITISVASKIAAAGTALFGAAEGEASLASGILATAMSAIPIVAVAAAFAIAAYEIYKHWGAIAGFFGKVWGKIKSVFGGAIGWLRGHWKLFLGLPGLVWQYWGPITGFFSGLWNTIEGVFNSAVGFMRRIGGRIASAFSSAIQGGLGIVTGAINMVFIDPINALIGAIDAVKLPAVGFSIFGHHIGFPGWGGFAIPKIPTLDVGGDVTKTGLAVVHRGESFSGASGQHWGRLMAGILQGAGLALRGGNGYVGAAGYGLAGAGGGGGMLVAEVPISIHMSDARVLREQQRVTLREKRRGHRP